MCAGQRTTPARNAESLLRLREKTGLVYSEKMRSVPVPEAFKRAFFMVAALFFGLGPRLPLLLMPRPSLSLVAFDALPKPISHPPCILTVRLDIDVLFVFFPLTLAPSSESPASLGVPPTYGLALRSNPPEPFVEAAPAAARGRARVAPRRVLPDRPRQEERWGAYRFDAV